MANLFIVYLHRRASNYTGPIGKVIAEDANEMAVMLGTRLASPEAWHGRYGTTGEILLHDVSRGSESYIRERTTHKGDQS